MNAKNADERMIERKIDDAKSYAYETKDKFDVLVATTIIENGLDRTARGRFGAGRSTAVRSDNIRRSPRLPYGQQEEDIDNHYIFYIFIHVTISILIRIL